MNKYFSYHWLHAFWLLLLCGVSYLGSGVQATWFPASGFGVAQAASNEPTLAIPDNLSVTTGAAIAVPVTFAANNTGVVATIFSLDFDQRCLAFDATDGNHDGIPDAITFAGLPAHSSSVSYNQTDTDGELDFVIADYQTPLDLLPAAAPLVTVTLRASCLPPPGQAVQAAILFSTSPRASFSDAQGRDVSGSAQGGAVTIFAELPPPTTTPTASATTSPTATPTPTATATATTTGNATATATTTETTSAPTASPSATATPTVTVSVTPPTPTTTPTATLIPTAPPTPDITNRAPEPANDQLTTDEDQAITFRPLANDTDADGDTITLVALAQAHLGALTFVNQETVSYAPAKDVSGTDSFLYFVRDQRGKEATALVTVLIRPVNDAPTIGPIVDQRHQVGDLVLLPVVIGDVDTPLSALTYAVSALPPQLSFNSSTQQIMGEVISSATGVYSSSITVSDGALSSTVRFGWTILAAGQTAHRHFLPLIVNGSDPRGHRANPAQPLRD